jgi:hypothetical protein
MDRDSKIQNRNPRAMQDVKPAAPAKPLVNPFTGMSHTAPGTAHQNPPAQPAAVAKPALAAPTQVTAPKTLNAEVVASIPVAQQLLIAALKLPLHRNRAIIKFRL